MLKNKTVTRFLYALALISLVLLAFMYFTLNTSSIISQFVSKSPALIQAASTTVPDSDDRAPEVIRILYATRLYWRPKWRLGDGSAPLSTCPNMIGRCEFTNNMSLVNDSDALLFFMRNRVDTHTFRQPHQKWIFAIYESPVHTHINPKRFENVFNLTMTYVHSHENDIDWSYGRCFRITDNDRRFRAELTTGARLNGTASSISSHHVNYAHGKKYLVAWFVSNCISTSRREMYVKEMQRYADIHIYGCGPYTCSINKKKYCDEDLLTNNYKFYLSFENSFCKDYVTEKLWRVMSIDIVPIVLGHANYSQMLPPHSYIDVRDFASPKHLVDYLKLLDSNDALYNEYFGWKTSYRCASVNLNVGCDICRYLDETRGRQHRVKNLTSFWGVDNNCVDFRTFYTNLGVDAGAWPTWAEAKAKGRLEAKKKKEAMEKLKPSVKIKANNVNK